MVVNSSTDWERLVPKGSMSRKLAVPLASPSTVDTETLSLTAEETWSAALCAIRVWNCGLADRGLRVSTNSAVLRTSFFIHEAASRAGTHIAAMAAKRKLPPNE